MRSRYFICLLAVFGLILISAQIARADVYVYKDKNGVLTFTNVPNHTGFRRVLREGVASQLQSVALRNSYEPLIRLVSSRHSVDADLIRAVIKTESDFNPAARSHKGAMGLMQLMPDTAKLHNVSDAYNPRDNVDGGVRHLRMLLDRYQGNLELSLAAYNAGSAAVEKHQGIPPFAETREYVKRVLRFYDHYRNEGLRLAGPVNQ
jgi:soluble lytic murein transglycosylase